jgi:hypothetical protein
VHLLFEYIPIKLETWISNINDQFIENFRDQLIKFSAFLANNYIKIDFQLKNIGMDQNYGAKYFLDLDFALDTAINREKLKSIYIREITSLFKPYIVSTANTNRDGTGTIVTVFTAGASGSRIDDIVVTATGTTTAGMVRLFLNDGTNTRLWAEIPVTAVTPSGTVQAFTSSMLNQALILPNGWSLRAATNNAETFNIFVDRAGDF